MNAGVVPNRVAIQDAVLVIDGPCIELRSGRSSIGDAVNALSVDEPRPEGADSDGIEANALDDPSRCSSCPSRPEEASASPKISAESFCSSASVVATA